MIYNMYICICICIYVYVYLYHHHHHHHPHPHPHPHPRHHYIYIILYVSSWLWFMIILCVCAWNGTVLSTSWIFSLSLVSGVCSMCWCESPSSSTISSISRRVWKSLKHLRNWAILGPNLSPSKWPFGDGSKPWYLVNPKIAGKWMFIPLKMVLIGIDP